MKTPLILLLLLPFLLLSVVGSEKPNFVVIFADDMGYGDVQILNPNRGKIPTPYIDELAREGIIFTDAHTSSSVCTPSRYSLLTGRYNWRTPKQFGVLSGYGRPLIDIGRPTVASILQEQGYLTAMIGKWHLGLELPTMGDAPLKQDEMTNIDWNGVIENGPVNLGFDYFFGISASLDMPPYIYIENNRFVGEATTLKAFHREGAAHADFEAVDVLDDLLEKAVEFIHSQDDTKPFFAYIPLPSPHTPIVPTPEWIGQSGLNAYGDFMMQTDAFVGDIMKALDDAGLADNTLVLVTSDNGCSMAAGFSELEAKGHFASAQFRGSKADLWDGGHRVPFIIRWPDGVAKGSVSDEIICMTDLFATFTELAGGEVPGKYAEDSVSFVPALKGVEIVTARKGIIHHSISGHFAYRQGRWKLLLSRGSAGWTGPKERDLVKVAPRGQLYDMDADPGETNNLYESRTDVVDALMSQFSEYVQSGRSTLGPESTNDVEKILLWK